MASPSQGLFVPEGDLSEKDITPLSTFLNDDDGAEQDDQEWNVEELLAERPHPESPGIMQYLIKWEGFPMNECTWEPAEHLGPGLLDEWEDTKKKIATGEKKPFDVWIYYKAVQGQSAQQDAAPADIKENPDHGHSAQEVDVTDPGPPPPKKTAEKATKQKETHAPPPDKPKAAANATPKVNKKKTSQVPLPAIPPQPPQRVPAPKRTASTTSNSATGTVTGYQGTARRPSGGSMASSPPAKRSSGLPPPLSSSLANKFSGKKHTATRTQPQPQPKPKPASTNNVFAGGKVRKKRTNLGEAMDDRSKAPKAFNNMRTMNLARKRGSERSEQVHLDVAEIPTGFLLTKDKNNSSTEEQTTPGSPSTSAGPSTIVASPTLMSPLAMSPPGDMSPAEPTPLVPVPPMQAPIPSLPVPPPATSTPTTSAPKVPKPKKKKSVRFTGAEDIPPDDVPMADVVDEMVNTTTDEQDNTGHSFTGQGLTKSPPPGPRRLSLTSYQERSPTQVVQKTIVFGKAGSQSVRAVFTEIPRQGQPWVPAFIAQELLHFDGVCTADNFKVHGAQLLGDVLSSGTVEFTSNKEVLAILRNVAENLRRRSHGAHMVNEHYSILVYPSECNDWNDLGINTETQKSESPLRHIVYKPLVNTRSYLPASVPRAPARLDSIQLGTHCQMLVKHLFGLDFSKCLPQQTKVKDRQVFLLLFPQREEQVCNMIKLWLRSCEPKCQVFSSTEPKDSFLKFHETVTAVRAGAVDAAGTVIIHEDISAEIRKIPGISLNIEGRHCYTFWDLATGQYNPPQFPSDPYATIKPGTLQMTRLFPHGRAFLITPSFALSEPVKLCQFLEWFRSYCGNPHYLIMACADFPNYLKAVALEKIREHQDMRMKYKNDPNIETLLTEFGLSETDLEARCKAWEALKEITKEYGEEDVSEDLRRVDWITNFIDPNDEQSLVNWFCWWSTTKCDVYRKFVVLGSSSRKTKAAYRNIEIPAYTAETVGDPDVALAREDQLRRAREAAARIGKDVLSDVASAKPSSIADSMVSRPASNIQGQPSQIDRASDLYNTINGILDRPSMGYIRLHGRPVSWFDVQMADHFGDPKCDYETFRNWLGAAHQFHHRSNTWCGMFYTIDKEWNPQAAPETYGRHPWIAILRPKNPHFAVYDDIELLIWDLSIENRMESRGKSPVLLDMQQRLVNLVKDEIGAKNLSYRLDRVFISSSVVRNLAPSKDPVTKTLEVLEALLRDIRSTLPPYDRIMKEVGWIQLSDSDWETDTTTTVAGASYPPSRLAATWRQQGHQGVPFPRNPTDDNKMQRSIWHAPRPKTKLDKSKCGNDLYKAAFRARMANHSCKGMAYQYRSTTDWYHDMKSEGRASGHVWVGSAEKIFPSLPNFQKK